MDEDPGGHPIESLRSTCLGSEFRRSTTSISSFLSLSEQMVHGLQGAGHVNETSMNLLSAYQTMCKEMEQRTKLLFDLETRLQQKEVELSQIETSLKKKQQVLHEEKAQLLEREEELSRREALLIQKLNRHGSKREQLMKAETRIIQDSEQILKQKKQLEHARSISNLYSRLEEELYPPVCFRMSMSTPSPPGEYWSSQETTPRRSSSFLKLHCISLGISELRGFDIFPHKGGAIQAGSSVCTQIQGFSNIFPIYKTLGISEFRGLDIQSCGYMVTCKSTWW